MRIAAAAGSAVERPEQRQQGAAEPEPAGQGQGQRPAGTAGQRGSCARSPKRCATPRPVCAGRIPNRRARSGERASERLRDLEQQMQASQSRRPPSRARRSAARNAPARRRAAACSPTKPRARRRARLATMRGVGWPASRSGSPIAPSVCRSNVEADGARRSGRVRANARPPTMPRASSSAQKLAERMRQSAEALRQENGNGSSDAKGQPSPGDRSKDASRQGEQAARTLDRIADRLGAATGAQDADSRRLSDQLSKTQELREQCRRARSRHRAAAARGRSGREAGLSLVGAESGRGKASPPAQQAQRGQQGRSRRSGTAERAGAILAGAGHRARLRQRARWVQRPAGRQRGRPATAHPAAAARGERTDARGRAAGRRDAPREPGHAGPNRTRAGGAASRRRAPRRSSRTSRAGSR